jgi:hypothetical protein
MIIADTCSSSSSSNSSSNSSSTYGAGSLAVAVYSTADAQFSIVLTPSGRTVQLIGGMQQHGSTRYYMYYSILYKLLRIAVHSACSALSSALCSEHCSCAIRLSQCF